MKKLYKHLSNESDITNLSRSGIYLIEHLSKPGLFYIGSASSIIGKKPCEFGFHKRFLQHLRDLEKKKHSSVYLQSVVNKYGIEKIRFKILEVCPNVSRLYILEREQHYIDTLNSSYNMSKTARCPTVPYTEERINKARKRMLGKKLPDEVYSKLRVPVYQFDKNLLFVKKYDSIQEASDISGIDRSSISNSASGKRRSAGGYYWSFSEKLFTKPIVRIQQYSLEGSLIRVFNSLEEVRKELQISSSTAIRNCFSGKQKTAYGFKWTRVSIIHENPKQAKELGLYH